MGCCVLVGLSIRDIDASVGDRSCTTMLYQEAESSSDKDDDQNQPEEEWAYLPSMSSSQSIME